MDAFPMVWKCNLLQAKSVRDECPECGEGKCNLDDRCALCQIRLGMRFHRESDLT
jgi:hypothetical protein